MSITKINKNQGASAGGGFGFTQAVVAGNNTITFLVEQDTNTYQVLTVLYDADDFNVDTSMKKATSKLTTGFTYNAPVDGTLYCVVVP